MGEAKRRRDAGDTTPREPQKPETHMTDDHAVYDDVTINTGAVLGGLAALLDPAEPDIATACRIWARLNIAADILSDQGLLNEPGRPLTAAERTLIQRKIKGRGPLTGISHRALAAGLPQRRGSAEGDLRCGCGGRRPGAAARQRQAQCQNR